MLRNRIRKVHTVQVFKLDMFRYCCQFKPNFQTYNDANQSQAYNHISRFTPLHIIMIKSLIGQVE